MQNALILALLTLESDGADKRTRHSPAHCHGGHLLVGKDGQQDCTDYDQDSALDCFANTSAESASVQLPVQTDEPDSEYPGLVSPTRQNQGDTGNCLMFAGASFIRAAIKKHFPNRRLPDHEDLRTDIAKRIDNNDDSNFRRSQLNAMEAVCNKYDLSFHEVPQLSYTRWIWRQLLEHRNHQCVLDKIKQHSENNDPLLVIVEKKSWYRIDRRLLQKKARGDPFRHITLDDIKTCPSDGNHRQIGGLYWYHRKSYDLLRWWNDYWNPTCFRKVMSVTPHVEAHAIVFDPDTSHDRISWMSAFKNSHNDDRFYINDEAMMEMIAHWEVDLYVSTPN